MKHCPKCGAELPAPNAAFCSECGARLMAIRPAAGKHAKPPAPKRKKKSVKKQKKIPQKKPPREELPYDGYYDDVLPSDDGEYRQGLDPKTIKKIAYILAGVLVIVALCVVALYLM